LSVKIFSYYIETCNLTNMSTNIMSVDLEDYYCDLPFSEWSNYDSRVVQNTHVILDLFKKYDVKSTFFCTRIYRREISRFD